MSKETALDSKPRVTERVQEYFKDTRGELRKVNWPSRQQATNLTLIVLAVTAAMAVFLGLTDLVFSTLIQQIIKLAG